MKARVAFWSITSAWAGCLFGFATVVISGAEQSIQKLRGLSETKGRSLEAVQRDLGLT